MSDLRPRMAFERSTAPNGLVVVRPNEVFAHVDVMVREIYGRRSELSDAVVVLGPQFVPPLHRLHHAFPGRRLIGYQLEQLEAAPDGLNGVLEEWLLAGAELWDYDLDNIALLEGRYGARPAFRPLVYVEALRRLRTAPEPDIDVLFYGTRNSRREAILRRITLKNRRRAVRWVVAWGAELDGLIERSKIVLNIHYYDAAIQEQPRLFYLLTNGKCVLSEASSRNYYGELIVEAAVDDLHHKVRELLAGDRWRGLAASATEGFIEWSRRQHACLR